jgi:hypothetical protein
MNQRSFSAPRNGLLPHDISGNEATSTSQAPHVKPQLLQEELHCSALHDLHRVMHRRSVLSAIVPQVICAVASAACEAA